MKQVKRDRFHGRQDTGGRACDWPGCDDEGDFRAPGARPPGFDGPGEYRWFCLDHIRQFNAGYDYFDGMSADDILRAQSPIHGWERETRAFRPTAGVDQAPRWADFADPLDAIGARARRFREGAERARQATGWHDSGPFTHEERRALGTMGLGRDTDRRALRERYAILLRSYHPDHNGGDRNHEERLRQVVEAYQLLRKSRAFA